MGTFRFKKFSVSDDSATMKVGTDAVLLSAWCPVGDARKILDIGTGSGVIALMLAQRSVETACVDAIEISPTDISQAAHNVRSSPWPHKVSLIHGTIQAHNPGYPYDLIVSNPPYFTNSLLPPDSRRTETRHDTQLPHKDLVNAANRLLGAHGTFCVILPTAEAVRFREICTANGLHMKRKTSFKTRSTKAVERELMEFGRLETQPIEEELVLYESGNIKTKAYQELTSEFYL